MAEVTMPRLSDTMEEGTIGRWLKQPGDQVEKGEILLEIETDKATMELESYESGTLQKILVQEGETVPIGQLIAMIGEGPAENGNGDGGAPIRTGEAAAAATAQSEPATRDASEAVATAAPPRSEGNGRTDDERIKVSPVARRLAEEYGIDLQQVQGTGPGGRIIKENIEAFHQRQVGTPAPAAQPSAAPTPPSQPSATPAAAPAPAARAPSPAPATPAPAQPAVAAPAGEVVPMSRMRRAIAKRMTDAKPGVPHIYVTTEVDMGEALRWRKQINDSGVAAVKISVNDMVVKASAKALQKFPAINSSYAVGSDGQPGVVQHAQINISVAVAIDEGLVAPTVVDADKKSLGTIAAEVKEMAARVREGKIKPSELEGGTFTVSNLGMFDVVEFGMIITTPQAAALAVGSVRQVPVVRDGEIVVGEIMHVSISLDHRVADGATAARYLQELKSLLQSPMSLLV